MDFSIRTVNALFKKELKDITKNINVLVMCIFPIFYGIVYSKILGGSGPNSPMIKTFILILCLGINLTVVASFVMAMLIAEEKEKNTLRTLMLSAVSPWEFLAGKALITLLVSEVINVLVFFIIGLNVQYLGKYMLLATLTLFSMIEIGAIIGIVAPNQMTTGVVGMPVLMIFLIAPVYARLNKTLRTIAEFLPNYNMNLLLERVFKGEAIGTESTYNISVILIWIIIAAAIFMYAYNKKGLDK